MKIKAYSLYSKLISLCITALGFGACNDPVDEYGTPSAKYKVSGEIVSEDTKEPIKNIRVVMVEDIDESKYPNLRGDTVYTNAEGKFEIGTHFDFPIDKFKIKIQDADGVENGEFEDKQQTIEFQKSDYKGGNDWYKGEAKKDLGIIELEPKQPE